MRLPNGEEAHVYTERQLAEICARTAATCLRQMAERAYDEARECRGRGAERAAEGVGHAVRGRVLEGAAETFEGTLS